MEPGRPEASFGLLKVPKSYFQLFFFFFLPFYFLSSLLEVIRSNFITLSSIFRPTLDSWTENGKPKEIQRRKISDFTTYFLRIPINIYKKPVTRIWQPDINKREERKRRRRRRGCSFFIAYWLLLFGAALSLSLAQLIRLSHLEIWLLDLLVEPGWSGARKLNGCLSSYLSESNSGIQLCVRRFVFGLRLIIYHASTTLPEPSFCSDFSSFRPAEQKTAAVPVKYKADPKMRMLVKKPSSTTNFLSFLSS